MIRYLLLLMLAPAFFSCDAQPPERKVKRDTTGRAKQREQMILMNQRKLKGESAAIDQYVAKHNLKVQKSGTGLRYSIDKKSTKTDNPGPHDTIMLSYTLESMGGNMFYDRRSAGGDSVILGTAMIPAGLEEAVKKMSPGDKAVIIMPGHLGYGMTGDGKKIGPGAVLVSRAELVKLIRNQPKK